MFFLCESVRKWLTSCQLFGPDSEKRNEVFGISVVLGLVLFGTMGCEKGIRMAKQSTGGQPF